MFSKQTTYTHGTLNPETMRGRLGAGLGVKAPSVQAAGARTAQTPGSWVGMAAICDLSAPEGGGDRIPGDQATKAGCT